MRKEKSVIKVFAVIAATVAAISLICLLGVFAYAKRNIDYEFDKRLFENAGRGGVSVFYADSGEDPEKYTPVEMEVYGNIRKSFYSVEEMPEVLINGFIAVEDRNFYDHSGIDIKRTLSAAVNYFFGGEKKFGASTITQQVVKNISGDNEVTISRKFSEILRARNIERNYSKDDIMEIYLNVIPMSENMYGVGIASRAYFGKEPQELSAAEAATLIGITNAPSAYNPYINPEASKRKRDAVLAIMHAEGVIDGAEYEAAVSSELSVQLREQAGDKFNSWFVETAVEDISRDISSKYKVGDSSARLMLLSGGYSVYTTANIKIQRALEEYFEDEDNFPAQINDGLEYSMVITDSDTAELLAVVGRVGEKKGNLLLNHATLPHTPGSVLKPLALYAPLLDAGRINSATVFDDTPVSFTEKDGEYTAFPKNSPNRYDGLITVKDALKYSKNTVAVRLCELLTPQRVFSLLKYDFGLDTLVERETRDGRTLTDIAISPMALGQLTRGVSLRKLTECYTVFPSDGVLNQGRSYICVRDNRGEAVLESTNSQKRIFKPECARIMNTLLSGVTDEGTAKSLTLKNDVALAGKTGTSGNNRDKMFIGYTPTLTAGIWCGYEKGEGSVAGIYPSHLQIWDEVMRKIYQECVNNKKSKQEFTNEGIYEREFCKDSGELYNENCVFDPRGDRKDHAYFTLDNMPSAPCSRHVVCRYDTEGKGIANSYCPHESIAPVSLIKVSRSFPCEVYITDAEFVYRDISGYSKIPKTDELPYFYYALPEGEYAGITNRKKQFNSSCIVH